ncbi:hypothetical protein [Microbulbifer epialgicus]|uniref:5-carboxymethyl-2-hydroxymuconate isomerase n=1 Tax=Microbulbifer epialgicus TaxID=393907 RepID=A0ABV4P6Y0_9GAMM
MPSLKIFLDGKKGVTDANLETFGQVVIQGLEAKGERAMVSVIMDARVTPSGCYVELTCRHKPNRTSKMRKKLAERLDETARRIFGIEQPIRVRIIMVDEDLLSGVN